MQLPAIWVTRPQAQAEHTAALLKLRGIPSIVCPVMQMLPEPLRMPALMPDAIAISSQHALHTLKDMPESWRNIPVYTVGARSAQAVQTLGFRCYTGLREGAASMAARIRETLPQGGHVLYCSGDIVHLDLGRALPGYDVERHVVYRSLGIEKPSTTLVAAIRQHQVIALTCFSSRSALLAAAQLQQADLQGEMPRIEALCLSPAITMAAQDAGFSKTRTAEGYGSGAMLTLAEQAIRAMA